MITTACLGILKVGCVIGAGALIVGWGVTLFEELRGGESTRNHPAARRPSPTRVPDQTGFTPAALELLADDDFAASHHAFLRLIGERR